MKTIREMAYEAGFAGTASVFYMKALERFAALVREDERQIIIAKNASEIERVNAHLKKLERQAAITAIKEALVREEAIAEANAKANASWTLMCEKMVAIEREECAKLVDDIEARCIGKDVDDPPLSHVAAAIRARSNT